MIHLVTRKFWANIIDGYRIWQKIKLKLNRGVIGLKPVGQSKGNVLISYMTLPFVIRQSMMDGHTNRWESMEMARIFLKKGYSVDVIDSSNKTFMPRKNYRFFLDIHDNMDRISHLLSLGCIKILHTTTSHWLFNNQAEYERLSELRNRRGVALEPRRTLPPSRSIHIADFISMVGNSQTESTYAFAKRSITKIPISTTHTYDSPTNKDFSSSKKNFLWLGGGGMVHKGLDIALEAFAGMPECNLIVCARIKSEQDFEKLYFKELYETSNISTLGLTDVGSEKFKEMIRGVAWILHPSFSEGQSGALVLGMHAGLVPIASLFSGIDADRLGILLKKNTVEEIRSAVREAISMPDDKIKQMAEASFEYANEFHTREKFSENFERFINSINDTKPVF